MRTLFVEQPWTAASLLFRPRYRAEVFDERDTPIAVVRERSGPGLQRPLRHTGFSGWTTFDLDVVAPHGQPILHIAKRFGRRPHVRVSTPQGQLIGTIKTHGAWQQSLHDATGQQLCFFGDIGRIETGGRAKRDGRRVRRDVVRINPGLTEPLHSLATACAVAFDVVRGTGTSHLSSGFDWPA